MGINAHIHTYTHTHVCRQIYLSMFVCIYVCIYRVPTYTGKLGKMKEVFPVREKSGNFEILEKSQGFFCQSGNFYDMLFCRFTSSRNFLFFQLGTHLC